MSKQYIKNFYNRDRLALTSLSKCGHCSTEQLKTFIADKRITNYLRDELVTREVLNKNNGEQIEGYKLTAKGRDFIEKEWGIRNNYIAQSINHDIGIANKYFSLTEEERASWKTETELKLEFHERLNDLRVNDYEKYKEVNKMIEDRLISVTDCSYIKEGVEIYFEIITNSYGQAEIQAKERFIEFMDIKIYETERV
ncbi:hypothetical protein PR262_08485 [Clostridioides difficile]|nr:hypothetical protein [Clostridioides difficile]HBH3439847.1 hypothetical protein [Clostridioides difficile]